LKHWWRGREERGKLKVITRQGRRNNPAKEQGRKENDRRRKRDQKGNEQGGQIGKGGERDG